MIRHRIVISHEARAYKEKVLSLRWQHQVPVIKVPVRVTIHAFPPDKRKRDVDNLRKVLFDSLTYAKILEDDSLIYEDPLYLNRYQMVRGGGLWVTIDGLPEDNQSYQMFEDLSSARKFTGDRDALKQSQDQQKANG